MPKQKILTFPNPILRLKAKGVQKNDKQTFRVIRDLYDTLASEKNPKGVGLAAPQIGQSIRICLVYSKPSRKLLVLINPEITWQSKRTNLGIKKTKSPLEGCLSVPGFWGLVRRHNKIKVRYQTPTNQIIVRKFAGFTAVVAQHEIDHLNGILFIDRVLEQKGKLYKLGKNKEGKEELVEVKLTQLSN